ncbi:chorismate mutase [Heliocybe sulcata]|uniref:Chorismate mutase n=1 Tax=Heliocybe sulcata TaxID=5364 RepID=A0A5C3N466_9AGAM|nr:chorismate mutase [Heliocybe sulcata]
MQSNYSVDEDPLSLDRIRSILTRLEDTIIFGLIERAQFAHNPKMYQKGAFKELRDMGFEGSWLEWFLKETESFHARARRYTSPDEYPFTPLSELPSPVLAPLKFKPILYPNNVNANKSILAFYTSSIVPRITRYATLKLACSKRAKGISGEDEFEDDGNYGSAATLDVEVLQAISKRVHYGKFVSESKFRSAPWDFIPHIQNPNPAALDALIVKPEVERRLLLRLRKKALNYARDATEADQLPSPTSPQEANGVNGTNGVNGVNGKIDVDGVVELYENYIIPLTKEVEVEYLLHRLDGLSQEQIEELAKR